MKICLLLALLLLIPLNAISYEVNVHRKVAREAIVLSNMRQYLISNLGLDMEADKFTADIIYTLNAKDWIESGSDWEDATIGASASLRFMNHFYDPTTGLGLNVGGLPVGDAVSSLVWGRGHVNNLFDWANTRDSYSAALTTANPTDRNAGFANIFRSLGQMIHLVHDKAVPAHVRNDAHLPILSTQRDMYERYTRDAANGSNHYPPLLYVGYEAVDLQTFNTFDSFWSNGGKGLAEFTNRNYLSRNTNIDDNVYALPTGIPGPGIFTETIYDPITGPFNVVVKYLIGNVTDQYRPTSSPAIRLAAYSYFDFETMNQSGDPAFTLNNNVHYDYANYLIPRAVGYSAGLLNYFFRGALEISAPSTYVYSITDGSVVPQQFTKIKAKVKNTTPNENVGTGSLQAVARYKVVPNYAPDLSNYPPDGSVMTNTPYLFSISTTTVISSLSSTTPAEFTFDFTGSPIPAGITDLTLQVVFKGTLGNEIDTAVAVGMKDLMEPTHLVFWNLTDRFSYGTLCPDNTGNYCYHLYSEDQINNDSTLKALLTAQGEDYTPRNFTFTFAFKDSEPTEILSPVAQANIPPGGHVRLIALIDGQSTFGNYVQFNWQSDYASDYFSGAITQTNPDGSIQATPISTFRFHQETGVPMPFFQHFDTGIINCYPETTGGCVINESEEPPAEPMPVPVMLMFN